MTPNKLYNSPPIKTETQHLGMLEQHFKEVTLNWCEWSKNTRLTVKYYIHSCFDGERGLSLYSVWLDNQPFMLCQDAGRGNQDYNTQYITDREVYQQALNYLLTLTPTQEEPVIYPPEKNIADLDQYYGWLTADLYNPDLKPNFKVGDIVLAEVLENHNRDLYAANPVKVWTRCKVLAVNPVNPTFTYQLKQLDRRWETEEEAAAGLRRRFEQMITDTDKGEVEASGNDTTVKPIAS